MPTLPVYFVSHGGGPWLWLKREMPYFDLLEASLRRMPAEIGIRPKAILCISAHWETRDFAVMTNPQPPMLYDYFGFPEHTYQVKYPAPGAPSVAERTAGLLEAAGFNVTRDHERGYDHGTFVPLAAAWPDADVPVTQLSICADFDPVRHFTAGTALRALREEGVLIIGSGLSYHNLRAFGVAAAQPSRSFDDWLNMAVSGDADSRQRVLSAWSDAPGARASHPREDHLVPLFVAAGAAGDDAVRRVYHEDDLLGGITVSSFRFG
jgi:aromatic ring-opening dioxygenase catalytic subunit (LigB family)